MALSLATFPQALEKWNHAEKQMARFTIRYELLRMGNDPIQESQKTRLIWVAANNDETSYLHLLRGTHAGSAGVREVRSSLRKLFYAVCG